MTFLDVCNWLIRLSHQLLAFHKDLVPDFRAMPIVLKPRLNPYADAWIVAGFALLEKQSTTNDGAFECPVPFIAVNLVSINRIV